MTEPADHFRAFLESIGFGADSDPHLERTPERVHEMLAELFSAAHTPAPTMSLFEATGTDGPVCVIGIPFRSMCVHHFMPFFGTVDVAYVPDVSMSGFGSFGRIVEWASRRPQIQERLVAQVAEALHDQLQPAGLLIRCRARQLCVEMTTARPGTYVTLDARGLLASDTSAYEATLRQLASTDQPL